MVIMESRFPKGVPLLLDVLGHRTNIVGPWDDGMGHAQAIHINSNSNYFEGAADPRCDGLALGW
jgi:gamma-glutamyltranspeptidase